MHLSHSAARALMLAAQGLDRRSQRSRAAAKEDVRDLIRDMGALQIDTIHVVARSPYLVLWSRLGDYDPRWLDELLAEGKVFEYWSHAACFLPIEDYPLYRRMQLDRGWVAGETGLFNRGPDWIMSHREMVDKLMGHIREHGPVQSSDFERTDGQQSGWFNWKPEKKALEVLHATGDLMIARRRNFQRIYDLRERVLQQALPGWDDSQAPSIDEVRRTLTLKAVRALGITQARWVPDYFRTPAKGNAALLERLAQEGALLRVEVEGWTVPGYVHADHAPLLSSAAGDGLEPVHTTLLSPFDPLVWDRTRCKAMFDFDYRIECYTPEVKRRYGYFTLPVLRRGLLIGRLDAKAHRKDGLFEVKVLHMEPGVQPDDKLVEDVAGALLECARWHKTPEVVVRQSDPPQLAAALQDATSSRPA
jgi:uncharacterized protein YcaQ